MCPELSQNVCEDHLSLAFYPETVICHSDILDQQHTLFLNHVPNLVTQYKLSVDEHAAHGVATVGSSAGSGSGIRSPTTEIGLGEHLNECLIKMLAASNCGQETYTPLHHSGAAEETSGDYSLHMSCNDNQLIPEIECGWMKDVLDDLLLTSHEMPPPVAPFSSVGHCSAMNLPSLLSPLGLTSKGEFPADLPHPLLPPSSGVSPQSVTSTSPGPVEAMQPSEYVPAPAPAPRSPSKAKSSSPTPEPLKTRDPKRLPRNGILQKVPKWALKATFGHVDQVEHVIRERQRRDDMSYKIATLESLLPKGRKRDRASVVHDSVQYVKLLQQRVEELTKKSEELRLTRSSKCSSLLTGHKEELKVGTALAEEFESLKHCRVVNFHVQVEGGDEAATVSNCRSSLSFLSLTMKALEQLQLDLCRSTITKMPDGTFFFVITSKVRSILTLFMLISDYAASRSFCGPFIIYTRAQDQVSSRIAVIIKEVGVEELVQVLLQALGA